MEYGHQAWSGKGILIDSWGVGPYILTAGGTIYYFEDSQRFGPQRLTAKGAEHSNPFTFAFWKVWYRWRDEGRQTIEGKKKGFLYCVVSNGRKRKKGKR